MKKGIRKLVVGLLVISAVPTQVFAAKPTTDKPATVVLSEKETAAMHDRLIEIKAMDLSNATRAEKKAIRKEVKEIQKTMASGNGGIFISLGALIIIILLLIIIF